MIIEENVPLGTLTTLKVGGAAHAVITVTTVEEVREAIRYAKEQSLPYYVLGEGSNVLAQDEGYAGVIIRMKIEGIDYEPEDDKTLVHVGAGVIWDTLVRDVANSGLWGFENLAGIPGTVGAAPVQNIGAYGADISETLVAVDVYDAAKEEMVRMDATECLLGYRDSRFKHDPNLIITRVSFRLSRTGTPRIEYGDLLKAKERGADLSSPETIGAEVRSIRSGKFPDLRLFGTAGSFFKNPILSEEVYETLSQKYGAIPRFPNPHGVKIPLAFVLDKVLNMRGYRKGNAWLFGAQPLVLVLDLDGTSNDIEMLAQEVEQRVADATGITIEREVRVMPK